MPRPSSDTSMTTVDPAARAETVTVACVALPAWIRWAGVSQPWSTALVTRCRSESATASRTRVSSSTSWPSRTSVTSLAVSSGVLRRRELADQLGEAGHHPAQRHHRQAHRAVADVGQPALPVLGPGEQLAGGGAELVAERDEGVQGVQDLGLGRRTGQCLANRATGTLVVGGQRSELAAVPRDPAYVELGDADDVDQVVHPPGRHPDRVAPAAAQVVRLGQLLLGEPRHDDRVVAGERGVQRGDDGGELLVTDRPGRAGHRAADALGRDEQHVDEVGTHGEPAVLERTQQVLGPVGDIDDTGQAEHPGRALDGVCVAEQPSHQLPRGRVCLEAQQALAQRGQPFLDLGAEGGDQLRVVRPACHPWPPRKRERSERFRGVELDTVS